MTLAGSTAKDRLSLQRDGWEPLPVVGKIPVQRNWNVGDITPERVERDNVAVPHATGTGLRTGRVVGVDNDVRNPEHAHAIEQTITGVLGDTLFRRYGAKPRPMLLYINSSPIGKVTISGRAPGEERETRVEFLGIGQQFVAYGLHPDTGLPYRWEHEGLFEPLHADPNALPEITPTQIDLSADAAANKFRELGYTKVSVNGRRKGTTVAPPKQGWPITRACLEQKLARIDPGSDRNTWLSVAGALKHAEHHNLVTCDDLKTPEPSFDGLELFTRWSAGELQ